MSGVLGEALRALGVAAAAVALLPVVAWIEARMRPRAPGGARVPPASAIAVLVKLLEKRAARQEGADRVLHAAAPVLAIVPVASLLALVPLGPADGGRAGTLLLALALPYVSTAAVALAGYAGGNRLALLGALRLALLRASASVVVGIGALGAARVAETLVLDGIVHAQARALSGGVPAWGALSAPLGFVASVLALALVAQQAARARAEGEIDLVDPYSVEAAGPVLLGHRVFERLDLLASSALVASLFLGGWVPPGVDANGPLAATLGPLVVAAKTIAVTTLVLFLRRALPPLDPARAVRLCWTTLAPCAAFGLVLLDVVAAVLATVR